MARLPYVQLEDVTLSDLGALSREIVELRGRILNLHRILANNPPALRAFMGMSRFVRDDSSLPDSLRELAVLAVAHSLNDDYQVHQHTSIARSVGVTDVQLDELPDWHRSPNFSAVERSVVAFAWGATAERRVTDDVFAEVEMHLSPPQLVDLAITVGWYHLCHVLIDSLGIELELGES